MIKEGSIVLQKNTLVNKVNFKDNKQNRFSVVLFEFTLNNEEFVCSCPITNHVQTMKNFNKYSLYIPFQILTDKKLCSIKIDSVYFYPKKEITQTGLELNNETILKIYDILINIENNKVVLNSNELKILKNNILKISKKIKTEQKKLKKKKNNNIK